MHDPNRFILHVDMDAFFAAVAVLDNPSLAGKCLLVGGSGNRGVVSTASYEARKFGCHSAMPMARARALCPHAIVVKGDYARYSQLSRQIMDILGHFSPLVQPISIDEAFLDLTGTQALLGEAKDVARRIKTRIKTETGLNASVGVAPNKFLAKLASDLEKPDGLTIIPADRVDEILIPLPITKIWGIGGKTAAKLHDIGVRTIGDLRDRGLEWLRARFGESGDHFHRLAYGIDSREVHPREDAKSIGQEQTFGVDLVSLEEIRRVVLDHCEEVGRRVRRHGYRSARVVVKIRYGNYKTITRSHTLPEPTDSTTVIYDAARKLFDEWAAKSFSPVRLIGVQAASLETPGEQQLPLFVDEKVEKQRVLDRTLDRITTKLGGTMIKRGM